MTFIPYARQSISSDDIRRVSEALTGERITQGPLAEQFAEAVAGYCGARYAVPVSNGSMGLIAACQAAGIGPGDRVWTTPNTYVATANAALHCGAEIDFVDIDPHSYNLSPAALRDKLVKAERLGRLPKAVIPVHFAGRLCDMAELAALAARYGFILIEDACHALGGSYQGDKIGSCRHSDMAVFSFHPTKSITTGEGGMVLTNDSGLYHRLLACANQGIERDAGRLQNEPAGPWYYEQQSLGFNMRLTEMQAALGLDQLQRLDQLVDRRRVLARRYGALLASSGLDCPAMQEADESAWHLYVIQYDFEQHGINKKRMVEQLAQAGIGVQVHYIPVHTQPYFQGLGFVWGDFPVSEAYYRAALSLPLYPDLTEQQQDRVVAEVNRLLN